TRLRALRVRRQSARDHLETVVEACGDPGHRADKGALPAADHAQFQSSCHRVRLLRHLIRSKRSIRALGSRALAIGCSWRMRHAQGSHAWASITRATCSNNRTVARATTLPDAQ